MFPVKGKTAVKGGYSESVIVPINAFNKLIFNKNKKNDDDDDDDDSDSSNSVSSASDSEGKEAKQQEGGGVRHVRTKRRKRRRKDDEAFEEYLKRHRGINYDNSPLATNEGLTSAAAAAAAAAGAGAGAASAAARNRLFPLNVDSRISSVVSQFPISDSWKISRLLYIIMRNERKISWVPNTFELILDGKIVENTNFIEQLNFLYGKEDVVKIPNKTYDFLETLQEILRPEPVEALPGIIGTRLEKIFSEVGKEREIMARDEVNERKKLREKEEKEEKEKMEMWQKIEQERKEKLEAERKEKEEKEAEVKRKEKEEKEAEVKKEEEEKEKKEAEVKEEKEKKEAEEVKRKEEERKEAEEKKSKEKEEKEAEAKKRKEAEEKEKEFQNLSLGEKITQLANAQVILNDSNWDPDEKTKQIQKLNKNLQKSIDDEVNVIRAQRQKEADQLKKEIEQLEMNEQNDEQIGEIQNEIEGLIGENMEANIYEQVSDAINAEADRLRQLWATAAPGEKKLFLERVAEIVSTVAHDYEKNVKRNDEEEEEEEEVEVEEEQQGQEQQQEEEEEEEGAEGGNNNVDDVFDNVPAEVDEDLLLAKERKNVQFVRNDHRDNLKKSQKITSELARRKSVRKKSSVSRYSAEEIDKKDKEDNKKASKKRQQEKKDAKETRK